MPANSHSLQRNKDWNIEKILEILNARMEHEGDTDTACHLLAGNPPLEFHIELYRKRGEVNVNIHAHGGYADNLRLSEITEIRTNRNKRYVEFIGSEDDLVSKLRIHCDPESARYGIVYSKKSK